MLLLVKFLSFCNFIPKLLNFLQFFHEPMPRPYAKDLWMKTRIYPCSLICGLCFESGESFTFWTGKLRFVEANCWYTVKRTPHCKQVIGILLFVQNTNNICLGHFSIWTSRCKSCPWKNECCTAPHNQLTQLRVTCLFAFFMVPRLSLKLWKSLSM